VRISIDPEPTGDSMRLSPFLTAILSVLLSGGLVVWILCKLEVPLALAVLGEARWEWLAAAPLLLGGGVLCGAYRWLCIARIQKDVNVTLGVALRATLAAAALNSFLPSKGGEFAKALKIRNGNGITTGIGTVSLERSVDLFVLGLLGVAGALASGIPWGVLAGGSLCTGVVILVTAVLCLPISRIPLRGKARIWLEEVREVYRCWIRDGRALYRTLLGSLGAWTFGALIVCLLINAFGGGVSWSHAFCIYPLAVLAGLFPLTVSGMGTRDAAFVFLLSGPLATENAALVGFGYTLSLVSCPFLFRELRTLARAKGKKKAAAAGQGPEAILR